MVLVSHHYKFIYIKNKKVAGSSIESYFGKFCIDPKKEYHYNDSIEQHIDSFGIIGSRGSGYRSNDKWINHKSARDIKRDLGDAKFNQYLKFCVVRNPYDKMVSKYHWEKSKLSFKEFVKTTHVNNLNIHSINGKSVCNFFIRFEHLEQDVKTLCEKLGISTIQSLPNHKKTLGRKHWSEYYDDETREIVYNNHEQEFKLFGYDKILKIS